MIAPWPASRSGLQPPLAAPVRHAALRAVGDERLEHDRAVGAGLRREQVRPRRALAQHPVTAGAAVEEDALGLLELLGADFRRWRQRRLLGLRDGRRGAARREPGHDRGGAGGPPAAARCPPPPWGPPARPAGVWRASPPPPATNSTSGARPGASSMSL